MSVKCGEIEKREKRTEREGLSRETETGRQLGDNESLGANRLKMLHLYFN